MNDVIVALIAGAAGGWLAGMLGGGGGGIFVPVMVLIMGRSQHEAQGVSLAAIIVTAAAATLVHQRNGYVDSRAALLIAPGAIVFGFAGGLLANRLPAEALQRIFALVLMSLSVRMLYQDWRRGLAVRSRTVSP